VSDPSGRYPIGVLARPAPDWFDDKLGCGGYTMQNGNTGFVNYVAVSLFNNSSDGSIFKVYGIAAGTSIGTSSSVFSIYGTLGTFVENCSSIRPDVAPPYGQIYQATTTESTTIVVNPYIYPPLLGLIGLGFGGTTVLSPYPLFIVPVGYSLIVVNNFSADQIGASFWYQVAHV
jgi:hypothetical protein